jgi:ADP-dependent NAD(P)H-hydrate dehydratase / NAD(P)H-hydrate epimerase
LEANVKLVTVAEMQAVEREADASGITYEKMMENAGLNLAEVVRTMFEGETTPRVLGLVGSGNNGGDTLVALAHLANNGWQAAAYLARPRPEDDPLMVRLENAGGLLVSAQDDPGFVQLGELIGQYPVFLDGLLGTGIHLPLREEAAAVLQAAGNALVETGQRPYVVAVDCPSGVDLDSGQVANETIQADLTVTMAAVKVGLLRFPAYSYVGELQVVDIGPVEGLSSWQNLRREVVQSGWVNSILPDRPLDAHKGTFGTAFIAAGSSNYTGAALLAGEAAYRSGAGLVTIALPASLHLALAGQLPEATWVLLPHDMGVISRGAAAITRQNLQRATALLLGPGFGLEDTTKEYLNQLLGAPREGRRSYGFASQRAEAGPAEAAGRADLPPLVVDADGLKLLARLPDWSKRLPEKSILTPHPGEMSVLTGLDKDEIQAGRLETAERFASEWGHIVVLKGAFTVIASPDGQTAVVPVATPALARAGTGDVLAGLIVGLLAQGVPPFEAACAGAYIHAEAGLAAVEAMGNTACVLAGDVLNAIPDVMTALMAVRE